MAMLKVLIYTSHFLGLHKEQKKKKKAKTALFFETNTSACFLLLSKETFVKKRCLKPHCAMCVHRT